MPHCPQPCRLPKAALALAVAGLAAAIGCTTEEGRLRSEIEASAAMHDELYRKRASLAHEASPLRRTGNFIAAEVRMALQRELTLEQLLDLREHMDASIRSERAKLERALKTQAERERDLAVVEAHLERRARLYARWQELANERKPGSGDRPDEVERRARDRMATLSGSSPAMLRNLANVLARDYGKLRIEVLQMEAEQDGTAADGLHGTRAYAEELLEQYAGLFARWQELANRKEPGSGDVENEVERLRRPELTRARGFSLVQLVGRLENDIQIIGAKIFGLEGELNASAGP